MKQISIKEILEFLRLSDYSYQYVGCDNGVVSGFSSLGNYKEKCFTWLKQQDNWREEYNKYNIPLLVTQLGCDTDVNVKNKIISVESRKIFFSIIDHFYGTEEHKESIGKYTFIGEDVVLGENVSIGNNCTIVGDIRIGAGTVIEDNVVIRNRVTIGKKCHIQSGCVLGEDGFGFIEDRNHKKTMIKHFGGLVMGDDVFVGMHTNIARGVLDDTVIENGVKIAPTSHIGHNNHIDKDAVFICSQSYGSVHIGEDAYVVGSIVRNHCTVGDQSMVGMGSVVVKDIPENKVAIGTPARVTDDRYKHWEGN